MVLLREGMSRTGPGQCYFRSFAFRLVGSAADAVAAHHVFVDDRSRKAPSTRAAHDDDLAAFERLLADAGVQGMGVGD
jgi:hypothetical protein